MYEYEKEPYLQEGLRQEFGARVKSLRKRHDISRLELASRTGIPFKTVGDIERGEKVMLDPEYVVTPLANCFDLRGIARDEFFAAAGLLPDTVAHDLQTSQEVWTPLHTMFYRSAALPAVITDPLYTIHSSNAYFNSLFKINPHRLSRRLFEGAGPNIMRFLLDPAFGVQQRFGNRHEFLAVLRGNLYSMRVSAVSHIGSPHYERLISALEQFPDFGPIWAEVGAPDYVPRLAGIPTIFDIGTDHEMQFVVALVFPPRFTLPEQRRMLFIPANVETERHIHAMRIAITPAVYHYSTHFPSGYREIRDV